MMGDSGGGEAADLYGAAGEFQAGLEQLQLESGQPGKGASCIKECE